MGYNGNVRSDDPIEFFLRWPQWADIFLGGGRTTIAARWVPMRPEDPDVRQFQWLRKRWEPAWRSIGETDGHNPEAGDLERLSVFRSTLRG